MAQYKNDEIIAVAGPELEALKQELMNEFQNKYMTWKGETVLVTTVLQRIFETANGKINLVLADELPLTTDANTQYWVKTYDGTTLTNGRFIIVTDSLNVAEYVGTTEVDVSKLLSIPEVSYTYSDGDTITQQELKDRITALQPIKINGITYFNVQDSSTQTRYSATIFSTSRNVPTICVIIVTKADWVMQIKIQDVADASGKQDKTEGHLYFFQKSTVDAKADLMVFDFTPNDWTSGSLEVIEKKITSAWINDPITGEQRYGTVETTQFFHTGRNYIYIKQYFKTVQYALRDARMEFYRQGYVALDNSAQYTNWVASKRDSITWNNWIPYEYPAYNVSNIPISGKGQFSYIMIAISGGNMTMRGIYSCSSGGVNIDTEIMTFPFKLKIGGGITTYYDKFPNANLTGTIDAIFDNQNKFRVVPTATGDFRICSTIPIGY